MGEKIHMSEKAAAAASKSKVDDKHLDIMAETRRIMAEQKKKLEELGEETRKQELSPGFVAKRPVEQVEELMEELAPGAVSGRPVPKKPKVFPPARDNPKLKLWAVHSHIPKCKDSDLPKSALYFYVKKKAKRDLVKDDMQYK